MDFIEVLAIETESFPGNALTVDYFREALSSLELSVFVAEETYDYHVVGYLQTSQCKKQKKNGIRGKRD